MPDGVEEMYREHVLEHYKNPRNFGVLDPADVDHSEDNPLCGDEVRITLRLGEGGKVDAIRFEGRGCAISQASTSLLTTRVEGMTIDDVRKLSRDDVLSMLGVPVSPVRLKCALLGLSALHAALERR